MMNHLHQVLPIEMIIQIMSYMYPLHLGRYIQPDIEYLNDNSNYKKIKEQCLDIINLSFVCRYFYNIIRENGMKILYFDKNIEICVINRYKSKYLIALNDLELNDNQLKTLTNLIYLNLWESEDITDTGINPLTNLIYLNLWENQNITDYGIKSLINLTYLHLWKNENVTDEGIKSLINLTHLKLNFNKNITDDGIKSLTKLTYLYIYYDNNITDDGIKPLINLIELFLHSNRNISNNGIKPLINLKKYITANIYGI